MSQPVASLNITIDANGNATGEMSPVQYGVKWRITRFTTQANSALQTRLFIWLNNSGGFPVDSTYLGNGAASELPNAVTLIGGDKLIWEWQGGTAGGTVTGIAYGEVLRA